MKKESLEVALEVIIHEIAEVEIDITDRIELMLNLREFLRPEKYDNNIKTLAKTNKKHL